MIATAQREEMAAGFGHAGHVSCHGKSPTIRERVQRVSHQFSWLKQWKINHRFHIFEYFGWFIIYTTTIHMVTGGWWVQMTLLENHIYSIIFLLRSETGVSQSGTFGTMEFYDCPFGKIFMPSDSNGLIFFRGVQTTTPTLDCCR